jgi:HD-GYP domain-containing protein (c-di-GMP phosphodiesterase class II)
LNQNMQDKVSEKHNVFESIFWVSLGLGIIFWIVDAILTVLSSSGFSFLQTLIGIETKDIWPRLIVFCLLVVFASHVQYTTKKRREAEEKLQETLDSLKRAVGTTIQALEAVLESRDPYTAGHQARSANLACAIAEEMGLSPDKIEGIHMAGIIHDIGKLSIPAEILTKPSKLTKLEYSLVKEHPHSGYDMIKEIESPWPLAQIVQQHHERMNGSGYPGNIKGDDILIEARVLAVADVVEAMASHRPYRPSLGLEEALKEIEKNKGILYDDVAANACLKLFREKGYQLS